MRSKITTAVFVLSLAFVTAFNLATPQKAFSQNENRYLATMPHPSTKDILSGKYIEDFEEYSTDQFLLRDKFITLNILSQLALGKKDANGVYFGKDGYLLEKVETLHQAQLTKNIAYLKQFFETLGTNPNIENYTALIVPTAPFVLADKLPNNANNFDQNLVLQQLAQASGIGGHFLNIYPALKENKGEYIYYRTDHHWTTLGAFIAYQQLCENWGLKETTVADYNITPVATNFLGTIYSKVQLPTQQADTMHSFVADNNFKVTYNYQQETNSLYNQAALATRDKYVYYLNGNNAITQIETGVKNGKHLLIIKDSFAHSFAPFMTDNFEKITMIDYRYFNQATSTLIEEENITHLLVLYNAVNFAQEKTLYNLVR